LSPSFRFPHQNPVHASPLTHTRYMPHSSLSSLFKYPKSNGWELQIIKLLIMSLSPLPCHLVLLRPKYSSQHPILKHPQPMFFPQCEWLSFTPIQTTGKIIILYSLIIFIFFDSKLED
jgi:hypothetical protein